MSGRRRREGGPAAHARARQPQQISAQIYGRLREEIITLVRPPGSLLSDKALSLQFGVSRTPVREAFLRLAEEGMIAIRPNAGTFVTKISPATLETAHFVRRALEEAAIADAADRVRPADVAALRRIVAAQTTHAGDADRSAFYRLDEEFHRTLMGIAGHADAWPVVDRAKAQLDRVRYLSLGYQHRQDEVIAEHTRVVDALADDDGAAARFHLAEHLQRSFAGLQRAVTIFSSYFEDAPAQAQAAPPRRGRRPATRPSSGR